METAPELGMAGNLYTRTSSIELYPSKHGDPSFVPGTIRIATIISGAWAYGGGYGTSSANQIRPEFPLGPGWGNSAAFREDSAALCRIL